MIRRGARMASRAIPSNTFPPTGFRDLCFPMISAFYGWLQRPAIDLVQKRTTAPSMVSPARTPTAPRTLRGGAYRLAECFRAPVAPWRRRSFRRWPGRPSWRVIERASTPTVFPAPAGSSGRPGEFPSELISRADSPSGCRSLTRKPSMFSWSTAGTPAARVIQNDWLPMFKLIIVCWS